MKQISRLEGDLLVIEGALVCAGRPDRALNAGRVFKDVFVDWVVEYTTRLNRDVLNATVSTRLFDLDPDAARLNRFIATGRHQHERKHRQEMKPLGNAIPVRGDRQRGDKDESDENSISGEREQIVLLMQEPHG